MLGRVFLLPGERVACSEAQGPIFSTLLPLEERTLKESGFSREKEAGSFISFSSPFYHVTDTLSHAPHGQVPEALLPLPELLVRTAFLTHSLTHLDDTHEIFLHFHYFSFPSYLISFSIISGPGLKPA